MRRSLKREGFDRKSIRRESIIYVKVLLTKFVNNTFTVNNINWYRREQLDAKQIWYKARTE